MITINLDKAKIIGHEIRRKNRSAEFAPYDDVIAKQIPGQFEDAESSRQSIRDKYVAIQLQIDSATTPDQIKQALGVQ